MPKSMFPYIGAVSVTVIFFHIAETLDMDNMLKPVLDGLYPEIIYDDGLVQEVIGSRRNISRDIAFRNPPTCVIPSLAVGDPFVYVAIAAAMDQEELPWM